MLKMICAAAIVLATPAMAEARSLKASDAMTPADVSCADFVHNADGSWTPNKTIKMGNIKLKAGKPLAPGKVVGGVDIAAHLTEACSKINSTT